MIFSSKRKNIKLILLIALGSFNTAFASQAPSLLSRFSPKLAHIIIQGGGYHARQGKAQNIGIEGLLGDRFTVNSQNDQNFLVGLGYFIDGLEKDRFSLLYGLNAYYFFPIVVKGKVIQEQQFTNLSYRYSLTNYPLYVSAKALIHTQSENYSLTVDLGIGPNFISTSQFSESSLDDGVTQPDNIFSGQTKVALSGMAGFGIKFNKAFGHLPLELGYRFFYLGQGQLNKANGQALDTLKTGSSYANALVLSLFF